MTIVKNTMKKAVVSSAILALLVGAQSSSMFSDSFTDCEKLVAMFDCTDCKNNDLKNFYPNMYEDVVCDGMNICPDGTLRQTCTWRRYFSIRCN